MADEAAESAEEVKCPECPPAGAPMWMATFSDLVTLLLTFFVLLLSFAKTEEHKYEAALGSIRNAFGGNALKHGKVIQLGKSPDDSPTFFESQNPIRPFPIEFLTMEGLLDKHEINRESQETLKVMKKDLKSYDLAQSADVYEMPEGIKVVLKDKIYFEKGSIKIREMNVAAFEKMVNLLKENPWTIFVQGHASKGEEGSNMDAFSLSSLRAGVISKLLVKKGVRPESISTVYYGDSRPDTAFTQQTDRQDDKDRRVEFIIRKTDLSQRGHKVNAQ